MPQLFSRWVLRHSLYLSLQQRHDALVERVVAQELERHELALEMAEVKLEIMRLEKHVKLLSSTIAKKAKSLP